MLIACCLLPTLAVKKKAIQLYFVYCHCQPLRILDPDVTVHGNYLEEETILPIMALVSQRAPDEFSALDNKSPEAFAAAARTLLMMRLASGTVTTATLQGLCLVAFFYFTSKNFLLLELLY